jgi:hypothetical protein
MARPMVQQGWDRRPHLPGASPQGRLPFWVDAVEKVENAAERE